MDTTRQQKNSIRMRIGFWEGKSSQNPKFLDKAEVEILKLRNELINLTQQKELF